MGIFGLGVVLAPALGPTVGGLLIDNYSWRYVFCWGRRSAFEHGPGRDLLPGRDTTVERGAFDLCGFVLLCVGIGALLAGISSGQREGWDSDYVLGAFFQVSAPGWASSSASALRPKPLLHLGVYANLRFLAASVVAFILAWGSCPIYLHPAFCADRSGVQPHGIRPAAHAGRACARRGHAPGGTLPTVCRRTPLS